MKYVDGLPDYYKLLKISPDAQADEVKKAFRMRAKELHPDTNEANSENLAAMRELLSAYETLIHTELREEYDIRYRQVFPEGGFDYRDFLKQNISSSDSAGKLIFFDLLHAHEKEAMDLYNALVREKDFDLSLTLDREDFMDCAFLIAEQYERDENFVAAFNLFKTLVKFELERPYFRHFFQEVLDRLRNLLIQKMNSNVTIDKHIDYVLQIAQLPLQIRERGVYMKKLAELYLQSGDKKKARFFLQEAKVMNPRLSGLANLEKRLQSTAFKTNNR